MPIRPQQLSDIYLGVMDDELYKLRTLHNFKKEVFIFEEQFKPADRNALQVVLRLSHSQGWNYNEYLDDQYGTDVDVAFARWTRLGDLWLPWGMRITG